ncbi:Zinc metalloproteinase nas-4 [Acropora cervicornis]|uniref:Metalloendopeptidase n=1 Tax=Acropora cervicornis TaxID=6130 RepID=A0AAD9PV82_ACRCE|nr:Zinc metalloproteinase nas-4 [Acropora cervicornis]
MFLTREQRYKAEHGMNVDVEHVNRRKRGSSTRSRHRWQGGVLVYSINTNLVSNSLAMSAIRAGMNEWQTKTCIRFKQRTNERDYVYFTSKDRGCYSYVGKIGGSQPINLERRCWSSGIVAHEIGGRVGLVVRALAFHRCGPRSITALGVICGLRLLVLYERFFPGYSAHALGFYHEQSRPDRDKYITVNYNNIIQGARNNFLIYRTGINSLGTPYDYGSIMHYGSRAFSKNGQATIVPKQLGVVIGQRNGLSPIDARQANLLYSCPSAPVSTRKPVPTPRNPGPPLNPACSRYRILNDPTREKKYVTQSRRSKCDRPLRKAWYRFTGPAGVQMPTKPVPSFRCGTSAPGWLRGSHPARVNQIVWRRVCFNFYGRTCIWSRRIRILNCRNFFLYELRSTAFCRLRYCGDNLKA